eukprot:3958383-Pyramimonas_sp.AAC.1
MRANGSHCRARGLCLGRHRSCLSQRVATCADFVESRRHVLRRRNRSPPHLRRWAAPAGLSHGGPFLAGTPAGLRRGGRGMERLPEPARSSLHRSPFLQRPVLSAARAADSRRVVSFTWLHRQ